MLKLHLILLLTYITFTKSVDKLKTEPYVEFDWLDEDKKSLTVTFKTTTTVPQLCCLYNGTHLCVPTCDPGTNSISCEFEGEKCKADGDNPAVKYYYRLYCDDTKCSDPSTLTTAEDAEVTVAVLNSGFIKVWLTFIFCLLVF